MGKEAASRRKRPRPRHSKDKKQKCPLCPKAFFHARNLHTHIGERNLIFLSLILTLCT